MTFNLGPKGRYNSLPVRSVEKRGIFSIGNHMGKDPKEGRI